MQNKVTVYKKLGETPLEALEHYRAEQVLLADKKDDQNLVTFWRSVPMTYAGRLDPMAEGELLILISEECKNKNKYLGLDKEYEVEILFGIETDTYDTLVIAKMTQGGYATTAHEQNVEGCRPAHTITESLRLSKYIGRFSQPYPSYSSKTVNGKQLHELARAGELPEEMPVKEVEIYSIERVSAQAYPAHELKQRIFGAIDLVKGDFRQEEIKATWNHVLSDPGQLFEVMDIKVTCSSGTYMRSLAHRIGIELGTGACALSIKRTKIIPPHHIPVLL